MNIAKSFKSRYESEDFKSMYADALIETFFNEKDFIIEKIVKIVNNEYDFMEQVDKVYYIDINKAEVIFQYIADNFEEFIVDFNSYWAGRLSLCSVSFGEQEEQLEGIYNSNTDKEYTKGYLKRIFEKENFYVSDNYAYYDLSSGIHIDLESSKIIHLLK